MVMMCEDSVRVCVQLRSRSLLGSGPCRRAPLRPTQPGAPEPPEPPGSPEPWPQARAAEPGAGRAAARAMEAGSDSGGAESPAPGPGPPDPDPLQPQHRTTNFFIDDILRPDFGCRKPELGPSARPGSARERVPAGGLSRPGLPGTPGLDSGCSTDSSASSASSSAASLPSPPRSSSTGPGTGSSGGSGGVKAEERSGAAAPDTSSPPLGVNGTGAGTAESQPLLWPAWVYCTRYSDRPSSGPRTRKLKKSRGGREEKRPRTAFSAEQLQRLRGEFTVNRYITEQRRQALARELGLNEAQIKIWFQNKRAKIKKASGLKNGLALQLMAQGLYNHSTTTVQEGGADSD